ncbi:MAG: hypothetical protein AB1410_00460 [Acidobacteriota bacterium]
MKRKRSFENFRELKKSTIKKRSRNIPLDKKIEEAIFLSELCRDLKKGIKKNARILSKDSQIIK